MTETTPYQATRDLDRAVVDEPESLGTLLGRVSRDLSMLVRQELALAQAELKASATRAGQSIGMFAGAAVAGFLFLVFLSVALWWAIGDRIGLGWAAVIVAAIWLVVAGVLAVVARNELRKVEGLPQTAETLSKIPNAVKGNEEDNR